MDEHVTYEDDVYLWSRQQAEALRRLAEGRADLPNDLDLANIAEEIEDVGRSELNAVKSLLANLVVHLLKVAVHPDDAGPARHWRTEIRAWHRRVGISYLPSMRHHIDQDRIWTWGYRDAAADLRLDGIVLPDRLQARAFDLSSLTDPELDVEELIARLRADPGDTSGAS